VKRTRFALERTQRGDAYMQAVITAVTHCTQL